ncbi:amidase [Gloeophyllum trabeum ATCC 11539]|uniref:amidase n=1 Tax=Gloeophyllum trabeum (strain ATCC 11539 / FP-39264 / Madison 617) TaxID=670483 RepID=S7S5B8_GLOTA|nr:amidase [Gloeophyllum trabeum ATCC 11539]EPQ61159.1 amidase [Gloeophyllum trabeum ATCC 11539]
MASDSVTPAAPDWRARCKAKKQQQQEAIPRAWLIETPPDDVLNVLDVPYKCGLLTPREIEITDTTDVGALLSKLASGQWSSVEVTTAFYKRAIIAQQLTNCLTEIFVERALQRAQEVDDHLKVTGKVMGPLHGLPISLKDQFKIKGLETTMGYASWIGKYADSDSVLTQILYECGAVPFVRTNVCQTLNWGETFNHVFGRTTNPWNRYLTCGGSSGGEGALVAMKGSPLGIGTDIGGSVRIPSAFCGLYTLRPSYERLPYAGAVNSQEGQESISSVPGPMTNAVSGVKLFMKAVLDSKPWNKDPLAVRKEWSDKEYALSEHGGGGQLSFAIMWDNGLLKPHPPLWRAMRMCKAALEDAGHKVIDWQPYQMLEIFRNAESIYAADGGHDFHVVCEESGEPVIQTMSPDTNKHDLALDEPLVQTVLGPEKKMLTAWELWQLHKEKRSLRKAQLDHWQATANQTGTGRPVDAIISPAAPYVAPPHGLNNDYFYTTFCNAMDYATSVVPVTFVDEELDRPVPPHEFYNHHDEANYKLYDPKLFHGAPVGLQLIGRTLEEEAVIAMTEILDNALGKYRAAARE